MCETWCFENALNKRKVSLPFRNQLKFRSNIRHDEFLITFSDISYELPIDLIEERTESKKEEIKIYSSCS